MKGSFKQEWCVDDAYHESDPNKEYVCQSWDLWHQSNNVIDTSRSNFFCVVEVEFNLKSVFKFFVNEFTSLMYG